MDNQPSPKAEAPKLTTMLEFLNTIDGDFVSHMKQPKSENLEKRATTRESERVPYSTKLTRRKRDETRKLRVQVKILKVQLAELRSKRLVHVKNASALPSEPWQSHIHWRSKAIVACEQRLLTDRTNRELKAIMADQERIRASILRLLIRTDAIREMDVEFVLKMNPQPDIPFLSLDFSDAVKEDLSSTLEGLYGEASAVFPVMDTSTVVSYRCQTFPLGISGTRVEISSSTPMSCSVQETGKLLWNFTTAISKNRASSFGYVDKKTPGPLDMTCVSSLREELLLLNTVSVFHQFNDGHQIVLVGAGRWFLPSIGLVLDDINWTVISSSSTNSEYKSVVRNHYNLEVASVAQDQAQEQRTILGLVGNRMRIITQAMQDLLLRQGERAAKRSQDNIEE
ncbi:hypothetical protein L914_13702 [Phytophthora nicotianae]|uniref:M96 mating-specific protein family n=1 Tax=Phytophthora nicotianae TaxID=4792 RepID=W2MXF9_PHYNI|nr:hypothetical protein L914_13702 [Phytophthora nicotianae]